MTAQSKYILVIGSTSGVGLQCIRHLSYDDSLPKIHAFCRDRSKLPGADKALCDSIITGDARNPLNIEQAISKTRADCVILATGNGADLRKSDTRQKTGAALALVMAQPQLHHVKAIVLSTNGAGESKIKVGMGIGALISFHLRHVLADHTLQEREFAHLMERTWIIRPTDLTNKKGGQHLVEFNDKQKGPTAEADRSDVAEWVVNKATANHFRGGRKVNLTSSR